MRRLPHMAVLFMLPALGAAVGASTVDFIQSVVVDHPSISPNGDGVQDSSWVTVTTAEACNSLVVTVEDTTAAARFKVLASAGPLDAGAEVRAVWDGTDSLGVILPEGGYQLHLLATRNDTVEHRFSGLFVDLTAPVVLLDRIEPGTYAPGIPDTDASVTVHIVVSGYQEGDDFSAAVYPPGQGAPVTIADGVTGDGAHQLVWRADESAADGTHTVRLSISDDAGNGTEAEGFVEVDTRSPDIGFDNMPEGRVNSLDPVLSGSCFDKSGVETPVLVWNDGPPFPPDAQHVSDDTLFWEFHVPDSVLGGGGYREGDYTLDVSCADLLGRESKRTGSFTIDTTPPAPPILSNVPATVESQPIAVTVRVPGHTGVDSLYLYRAHDGDTAVARAWMVDSETFTLFDVAVLLGTNLLWGITVDGAGNRSAPSSPVAVLFEKPIGIRIPEVFRGPGVFTIRTPKEAREVRVDLFTPAGELVASLGEPGPGTEFLIGWDLTNDDGLEVRNGVLLCVVTVQYDGERTVAKEFIAVVR